MPRERPAGHTGHKRRRDRRRTAPLQQQTTAAATPAYKAPVTIAAAKPSPPATSPAVQQALATQHKYITAELRRVGIIIGVLLIALVVIFILLR